MMNFAQHMPYESVVPILIKDEEFPFFSGTGFFVRFDPYETIYLVTAKHCLLSNGNIPKGLPEVKLNADPQCDRAVPFKNYMIGQLHGDENCEDVVAYEVDVLSREDYLALKKRALALPEQRIVNFLLSGITERQEKIRTLGYPAVSKEIDYDSKSGKATARGIVGTVKSSTSDMRWITVEDLNWKEGGIDGFSGSPVLALVPTPTTPVFPIPVGVLCTGRQNMFRFISINVVTDLIATSIIERGNAARAGTD